MRLLNKEDYEQFESENLHLFSFPFSRKYRRDLKEKQILQFHSSKILKKKGQGWC